MALEKIEVVEGPGEMDLALAILRGQNVLFTITGPDRLLTGFHSEKIAKKTFRCHVKEVKILSEYLSIKIIYTSYPNGFLNESSLEMWYSPKTRRGTVTKIHIKVASDIPFGIKKRIINWHAPEGIPINI